MADAIADLIKDGAIFYVSHSGGKDSQAMYALLKDLVPESQLVVVHADLGKVEWQGAATHIRKTISHPLNIVHARKTLLQMVLHRFETRPEVPSWPSSETRQCTSDLKRGPIQKFIRHDMKSRCASLAVNCIGIRAQESKSRAKKKAFSLNRTLSKAGRTVYDWMPIFDLTTEQVFETIREAGQSPFWVYLAGNDRMSCVFCIFGSEKDIRNGMRFNPDLFGDYLKVERQTGYSMFMNQSLADRAGLIPAVNLT